jgi:hypothetical protein
MQPPQALVFDCPDHVLSIVYSETLRYTIKRSFVAGNREASAEWWSAPAEAVVAGMLAQKQGFGMYTRILLRRLLG